MVAFELYRLYLREKSRVVDFPIRTPKSRNAFEKRPDKEIFNKVGELLTRKYYLSSGDIQLYVQANALKHKENFLPHLLLRRDAYKIFLKHKEEFSGDSYDDKVKAQCRFIKEYLMENNINFNHYLHVGSPPVILLHWKEGKVDESILVYCNVVADIRDKAYAKILFKKLIKNENLIKGRINRCKNLKTILEKEITFLKEW